MMKEIVLHCEVPDLAIDENGNPAPAGIRLTLGEVQDEKYDETMKSLSEIDPTLIFKAFGLGRFVEELNPQDFKLLSQDEYEEKYGEDW